MGLRGPVVFALLVLGVSAEEGADAPPPAAREALRRDGVWVGPKEFRQVFEAFGDPPSPIFVTSDGPIVAGYRLLEHTVMRMERWSFAKVPSGLAEVEAKLGETERELKLPAETAAAASRRARFVAAVGRLLLGDEPEGLDHATLAQARECAALVEKAEGRSMPPGLGPPDAGWMGFDWRVFRPRGIYAGDERMERAFRATRWLQSVPFRLERDEEVAAFWLLREAEGRASGFNPSPEWAEGLMPTADGYSRFRDAALNVDDENGFGPEQVAALRAELRKALAGRVNTDLLHETPRGDEARIAPWVPLPEDGLIFRLLHPEGRPPLPGKGFPAGLAVAAALGSPLAREGLPGAGDTPLTDGATWIAAAHRMRAALLDPAEPDAPALFSSPAWQRKSLRTALGSWALERNVWTLHSHEVVSYLGGPKQLPGLVEPDPEVFARLAEMGRVVLAWAEDSELDGQAVRLAYADGIRAYVRHSVAQLLDPDGFPPPSELRFLRWLEEIGLLTQEERKAASPPPGGADRGVRKRWDKTEGGEPEGDVEAEIRAVRARLDPVLAACERWYAKMTDLTVALDAPVPVEPLAARWKRWVELCTRLELLAHKQLRQRPWSDGDEAFLKGYGVALGELMGYSYGSVQHPEDDAPRAAAVICDPLNDVMRVVGTGRPRELWVLYPYRGEKVLCRGVVLSYHELDAKEAPTDAEWKAMLDSEEPPPEPPWITGE